MSQGKRQKGEKIPTNLYIFLKGFWHTECSFTKVEIKLFQATHLCSPSFTGMEGSGRWAHGALMGLLIAREKGLTAPICPCTRGGWGMGHGRSGVVLLKVHWRITVKSPPERKPAISTPLLWFPPDLGSSLKCAVFRESPSRAFYPWAFVSNSCQVISPL